MGVPNLYRWLSERYPLINRPVDESLPMPECDNFYLDANGILQVEASEKSSGKKETITIKAEKGRLSDDEIERMVKANFHEIERAYVERRHINQDALR